MSKGRKRKEKEPKIPPTTSQVWPDFSYFIYYGIGDLLVLST